MTERPVLALTMGDPAGIGPEITVRALLSPDVRPIARCFAIGDARVLERALKTCGLTAPLHRITAPEALADREGTIDVLHQDSADPDVLEMGKVQALGGEAAFAAIRESIALAMAGRVAGVVTAPINKESLKAAKIPFIGHTEMFAEYTGAREEMTMFAIGALKIFFLTRHVALIEAWQADRWGNLTYRESARNLNPVMAMGAALTIAETRHVVALGDIPPEHVHTPGPFVHRVIHVPE